MNASYSPELDTIDIFFSPTKALERLLGVYERDGIKQGLIADAFKPVREAWSAAVFLLGYSQITQNQYWLRENPQKNEAPDIFAIGINDAPIGKTGLSREIMEIEVCDYDEHAKTSVAEHIQNKLAGKAYHPETFLLCYVHVPGMEMRLIDIINALNRLKKSVREIWLLFHLAIEPGNFIISRIYLRDANLEKTNLQYKGNYIDLSKIIQQEMIKPSRRTSETDEGFFPLGIGYVPLPKAKNKV